MNVNAKRRIIVISVISTGLIIALCTKPLYFSIKATLAQYLLMQAWENQQRDPLVKQHSNKPWPWADTYPVAKLTLFSRKKDTSWIILAGLSGRNMAFAPAWLEDSAMPNNIGNTVISGHNDSHFRDLETVKVGDTFQLEDAFKQKKRYTVTALTIVDEKVTWPYQLTDNTQLTLITCYPFTASSTTKQQRLIINALAS